jgi:cysteine-rich repeat protein
MGKGFVLGCVLVLAACADHGNHDDHPVCGDHVAQFPEECDDGNVTNGDGCSSTCVLEPPCGNGTVAGDEECDDGNTQNGDGCSSLCKVEHVCGDGEQLPPEECDDGNLMNGDGCSSTCKNEPATRTIVASWSTQNVAGATQPCLAAMITFHWVRLDSMGNPIPASAGSDPLICSNGFGPSTLLIAGKYSVYLDAGGVATTIPKVVDATAADGSYSTRFVTDGGYFEVAWKLVGVTDPTPHDCAYFGFGANGKVKVTATLSVAPMTATAFDAMCVDAFLVTDIQALPANTTYTIALDGRNSQNAALGHLDVPGTHTILTHNQITDVGLQALPIPGF